MYWIKPRVVGIAFECLIIEFPMYLLVYLCTGP